MSTSTHQKTRSHHRGRSTQRRSPPQAEPPKGEAPAEEAGIEAEGEEAEDLGEEIEPEMEALLAIVQMDSDAAAAYRIAAELIDVKEVRDTLLAFAKDHDRHVQELGRIARERGYESESGEPDPEASTFASLAAALGSMATQPALLALLASEQFTNAAYATAVELIDDAEALAVVERGFADEQRHLKWLAAHKDENWDETESGRPSQSA